MLVVENGSTDATAEIVRALVDLDGSPRIVLLRSAKGMGNALRAGIEASSGDRVLLSADDLPFGFDDLDRADEVVPEPRVIIGSKAHPASVAERGFLRSLSTWGFRTMRRVILGSRVGDSQGTILADGEWLRAVARELDETGFLFSTQLCFAAEQQGAAIVEVPVRLSPHHAPKGSTVRLSDVW
ncbi:MAG: putative glycosyltransferase domain protein, partial [Actinotalea sp.]|nr:putative glycosyltransferase domain protein [Actinotalea sp.]